MDYDWVIETEPTWDAEKRRIVGAWPTAFPLLCRAHPGAGLPGRWWRAEADERVLGYGWMDVTWGDAEVWLAVAPEAVGWGVGTFLLDRIVSEARRQGIRYLYNVIPPEHPEPARLQRWLEKRSFALSGDGLYKRSVPSAWRRPELSLQEGGIRTY